MEATSDLFWHDLSFDQRARVMAAQVLSKVYSQKISPQDVLVLTSMEAYAASTVIENWNKAYDSNIRYSYVRGASNFDHVYLNVDNLPAISGRDSLENYENSESSEYAIQTASSPVLEYLKSKGSR